MMGPLFFNIFLTLLTQTRPAVGVVSSPEIREHLAYVREGDILMGYLARITGETCSGRISHSGVIDSEVVAFAVDQINNDTGLLPNISLGFVALDSCRSPLQALATSVYFLKEEPDEEVEKGQGLTLHQSSSDAGNMTKPRHYDVIGVIGTKQSSYAVNIAALLSAFKIPLISLYATSDELSDVSRFPYFMRMVSPDRYTSEVLVKIASTFNWTYVSLIYSEGTYGENGAKQIEKHIKHKEHKHLCIAFSYRIATDADEAEYSWIVQKMIQYEKARVVILLSEYNQQYKLFSELKRQKQHHKFLFLAGDFFRSFGDLNDGAIFTGHVEGIIPGMSEYVREMTPWSSPLNPWLRHVWQDVHNCVWEDKQDSNISCFNFRMPDRLWQRYRRASDESIMYDSVFVYGHALHKLVANHCPEQFLGVDKLKLRHCIDNNDLISYMKNVSFVGTRGKTVFDEKGDMREDIVIMNYQAAQRRWNRYKEVGLWHATSGTIEFNTSKVDWSALMNSSNNEGEQSESIPESVCSKPCGPRQYFIVQELQCCWECYFCRNNERLTSNGTACEVCPVATWPDAETATMCEKIAPTFLRWTSPVPIGIVTLGTIGIALTAFISSFFYKYRRHRLIRATSKELAVIILIGTFVTSFDVIFFVIKPTRISCIIRMLGFHFGVNLLYSPLAVKTIRIYRIFSAGKRSVKQPRFVSSTSQLALTVGTITIQTVVLTLCELMSPTKVVITMRVPTERFTELRCEQALASFLAPITVNFVLILVCAALGYLARKLPENFNESWYIFISVSTTLFMWLVFLPTYYTSFYASHQMALLAFCLVLNAYVTVGCLFLPKVYAILFVNEDQIKFSTMTETTSLNRVDSLTVPGPSAKQNQRLNKGGSKTRGCQGSVKESTA